MQNPSYKSIYGCSSGELLLDFFFHPTMFYLILSIQIAMRVQKKSNWTVANAIFEARIGWDAWIIAKIKWYKYKSPRATIIRERIFEMRTGDQSGEKSTPHWYLFLLCARYILYAASQLRVRVCVCVCGFRSKCLCPRFVTS